MTTKKWVVLYLSTIILLVIIFASGIIWIKPANNDIIERVENAAEVLVIKPVDLTPSDPEEANAMLRFYDDLRSCFAQNDTEGFRSILLNGEYRTLLFDSISGLCVGYDSTPNDVTSSVYIQDGSLMVTCEVVEPPEYEMGLSTKDFTDNDPVYRESLTKEGFISNFEWDTIEGYEHIAFYSPDIYYELLWTIDIAGDNAPYDWVIYKIPNNTYLLTNAVGWYDSESTCRIMVGKTIIIKEIDGEYKICAVIDIV